MNKTKLILTALFLAVSFFGFSQKVKLKKGEVLIDEVVWLNYQDCGTFDKTCSLLNKDKEEIVFFNWVTVPGAQPRTQSNPQGNLVYVEIKFLGLNKVFEIQKTQKDIVQLLYNSKVINEDLTINEEKASTLVEKYGKEFSVRY
jgi:hypothetical protein